MCFEEMTNSRHNISKRKSRKPMFASDVFNFHGDEVLADNSRIFPKML